MARSHIGETSRILDLWEMCGPQAMQKLPGAAHIWVVDSCNHLLKLLQLGGLLNIES